MSEIKPLFENINTFLLPKSITRSISKLNSCNRRNKSGETLELPVLIYFKESDCYILVEHFTDFNKKIQNGLEDENGVKITDDSKKALLNKYGDGFRDGYYNYEKVLKNQSSIFTITNEVYAYKIFEKVNDRFIPIGFKYLLKKDITSDKPKYNISGNTMYASGLKWGEMYKAWELILNNIVLFEPFFNKLENELKKVEEETSILPNLELNTQMEHIENKKSENNITNHPFSNYENFELFIFLDKSFNNPGEKSKFSYIYNHLKETKKEIALSQKDYFNFVRKYKEITISDRLQPAPSNKYDEELNRLVNQFYINKT
jgi:hypothetical protein